MRRRIEERLAHWQAKQQPLPLLLLGARQVGKTYTVRQFAQTHFRQVAYVNFQMDIARLTRLFEADLDPRRIVTDLGLLLGMKITAEDTVLIFDEVQLCQPALTSLKYFAEQCPQFRVIATGSLFGVTVSRAAQYSFPVGKVEVLHLYPMDFEEFLWALGHDDWALGIRDCFEQNRDFIGHDQTLSYYRQYLMVGGMPAAVKEFIATEDYPQVRAIQQDISLLYAADMNLYLDDADSARTQAIWHSAPQQLARETSKKFKLSDMKQGARAGQYEAGFAWLENAGLIYRNYQAEQPVAPLRPRGDGSFFKVYLADVGLVSQAMSIRPEVFLNEDERRLISGGFHGGLAENYVQQALKANNVDSCYWASGNTAEVDFLVVNSHMQVIPVEVKAGDNVRSRSLNVYRERYDPPYTIRLSTRRFGLDQGIRAVPLYAAYCLDADLA
ncbi:MAG: ATP-binding protein [Propionibacteriaceae bacterium]|jgi:predicted AAA+ superfamily ATPase|nr:ATP-binding protein [Propionibacteriaceae bacterium]